MLIACKCLNLIGASNDQVGIENHSAFGGNITPQSPTSLKGILTPSANAPVIGAGGIDRHFDEILQKQQTKKIQSDCLEFLRQAISLKDLNVTIVQNDLIYKVPIELWTLNYCINCNTVIYGKNTSNNIYLINSNLITNSDEINSLKLSKSFSKTFGILLINQQQQYKLNDKEYVTTNDNVINNNNNINLNKINQIRIKNLSQYLNIQLKQQIYETDEKIRRYTEQQFALLKSYREKAEQEYQILVSLFNQVPDELLKLFNNDNIDSVGITQSTIPPSSSTSTSSMINTNIIEHDNISTTTTETNNLDNVQSLFALKHQQQQLSSLDTPPATPDSTPMSIGNSPTFRQQQQQEQQHQQQQKSNIFGTGQNMFGSGGGGGSGILNSRTTSSTMMTGTLDSDCIFELEGMENYPISVSNNPDMSDVEETEDAEDAEDALGELDSAMQIPRSNMRKQSLSIARSLPISIATISDDRIQLASIDDELSEDSNVDIAASIKALAKSVHGDTVFGDLPRPRVGKQI